MQRKKNLSFLKDKLCQIIYPLKMKGLLAICKLQFNELKLPFGTTISSKDI